jgi:chemotaxis signal transduction protein
MALYKGVEIDKGLVSLIGRMGKVEEYQESLQSLQSVWDNLTLLGHLSGTGTDMSDTRTAFEQLTGSLLNQLGRETLKKTVLEMKSKAQVAVDIMIRNLFERTADIGFLAMDGAIRDYLAQGVALRSRSDEGDTSAQVELDQLDLALLKRFREYVQKYSVYSNIILLDTQGNVLLQLDSNNPARKTCDALVAESLTSSGGYVETFRKTDLLPDESAGLIYSYRVTDAAAASNLGVLCLCFRFADETEKIFSNLVGADDWSVITLLDHDGCVIASSDPHHVPVGAKLPLVLNTDWKVMRFAGREYLATTRATHGYQGYMGPGWCGHVMIPLDHAFVQESDKMLDSIPASALEAVMSNQQLFSEALREIPVQAGRIQRGLNRSVWNGNVSQRGDRKALNPAFSKVLLWEISNTGFKTQDVFERSIGNLHQTVVSSILQDSQFQAALAIDIMDRNLYERANDCRWWALAPVFRRVLSAAAPDEAALREVGATLAHINGLYTVYDNLVVFDKSGHALAVSNPQYRECCGRALNEDWVRQTLSLGDSQSYTVSGFAATPLYKGRHTYIYAAPIFDPDHERNVVGGIGIVFDAAPQFVAMLQDALPRDEKGEVPPGCFGVFADRERRVISSTHPDIKPGAQIDLDDKFFRIGNGSAASNIAVFNGAYYAVGACMSGGYREYKGEGDTYKNDVVSLVFVPLGEKHEHERRSAPAARNRSQNRNTKANGNSGESVEIATFYVDSHWVGIPSEHVVEAIDVKSVTRVPGAGENAVGYLMFRSTLVPVVGLWGMLGETGRRRPNHEPQIVILQLADGVMLGVMVDELGEIPEVHMEHIEKISGMLTGENMITECLVKPDENKGRKDMIVVISPDRLRKKFLASQPTG